MTHKMQDLSPQERHNLDVVLEFISLEKPLSPEDSARLRQPELRTGRVGLAGVQALTGFQGAGGFVKDSITERVDAVEDVIVRGDRVWVLGRLQGRHSAPIFGIPATHKSIDVSELLVFELRDGKIVYQAFTIDELAFLRQIGAVISFPEA